jgi:hypothetical protein
LTWNREAREALLEGYLDGDGYEYQSGRWAANTVSRELAYGIAQIARSVGRQAHVHAYDRAPEAVIQGRTIKQAPVRYEVKIKDAGPQSHGEWHPVRAIEPAGDRQVFNLTVRDEHTFIADGAVVHNCGDFAAYCYRLAGSRSVEVKPRSLWAYVPFLNRIAGATVVKQPQTGDLVRFDWNGDGLADHVGLFEKFTADGQIQSVDGNTSKDANVSDSTGGGDGVHRRVRPVSLVHDYVRIPR